MAFTYSGDPSQSEADYVRFMLGDTNPAAPILQDAEIAFIVSSTASVTATSRLATAFRAAATALGAKLVKRSLGPQSEDATNRLKYYQDQADKYDKISSYSGTPPAPDYASALVFDKNMMGNDA